MLLPLWESSSATLRIASRSTSKLSANAFKKIIAEPISSSYRWPSTETTGAG
jgi:hypothetical protein